MERSALCLCLSLPLALTWFGTSSSESRASRRLQHVQALAAFQPYGELVSDSSHRVNKVRLA